MTTKETYQRRIEAEVVMANAAIAELRADAKKYKASVSTKYAKHIDEVQRLSDSVIVKLTELGKSNDDSWIKFKDGVDRILRLLDVVIKGTPDRFKQKRTPQETKLTILG